MIWFETLHCTRCFKLGLFCTVYFHCLYRNVRNTKLCRLCCSVKAFLGGLPLKEQIFIISDSLRICLLLFLCILQDGINCASFVIFYYLKKIYISCTVQQESIEISNASDTKVLLCSLKAKSFHFNPKVNHWYLLKTSNCQQGVYQTTVQISLLILIAYVTLKN